MPQSDSAAVAETVAAAALHEGAQAPPARFMLLLEPVDDPVARRAEIPEGVAPLGADVRPFPALDPRMLVVECPHHAFEGSSAAPFAAAHRFVDAFGLAAAEPDLPSDFFPEASVDRFVVEDVSGFPPGCFVPNDRTVPPSGAFRCASNPASTSTPWAGRCSA